MALKLTTNFRGIEVTDAYYTVEQVNIYKREASYLAEVCYSIRAAQSEDPLGALNIDSFVPDMVSPDNFIKQGYNYLKQKAEFVGCKDA